MTFLTTRLTIAAAVALVAMAQAVISPASCCLLRMVLPAQASCCQAKLVSEPRTCCEARASAQNAGSNALEKSHSPVGAGICPVCSAGPKVSNSDRAVAPVPNVFDAIPATVLDTDAAPAATFERFQSFADTPLSRTAPAMCALLCVWLK